MAYGIEASSIWICSYNILDIALALGYNYITITDIQPELILEKLIRERDHSSG